MRNTFLWVQATVAPLPPCSSKMTAFQAGARFGATITVQNEDSKELASQNPDNKGIEGGIQRLNPPATKSTGEFLAHQVGITGE
jgi:hypothetical protein